MKRPLGTNLDEVRENVEGGFHAVVVEGGVRVQTLQVADQGLGNSLGDLRMKGAMRVSPLRQSTQRIRPWDPP